MIDHLSYSQIQEYLNCQRSYRHKYIDKIEVESNEALLFGSAWHRMISLFLSNNSLRHVAWRETGITGNMFVLGNEMLDTPAIFDTLFDLSPLVERCWSNGKLESNPPMIDHQIEYRIPHVDVPIIGYIDMIADDRVPVDFKTASRKWDQKQADLSLQPTFYLAGLHYQGFLKANDFPAKFRYIIFLKKPPYDVQVIETTRTASDIITLFGLIADCYEAIEKEVFLPTGAGGWKCSENYCDFWQLCKGGTKNEKL